MTPFVHVIFVAVGLLAGILLAQEGGFRAGRRARAMGHGGAADPQIGTIQGAVLGLLGLLLAFSFAAAGSRFFERQDLIVSEANAIGTSYLRAELLDEPQRTELRSALKAYAEHRVSISKKLSDGWQAAYLTEVEHLHERIWRAAKQGVDRRSELALAVLNPINELIDLHSLRVHAARKHIPQLVLWLLVACSLLAAAAIGYGCGMEGHRRWALTMTLTLLVWAALWVTIDLDHPRAGLLQLDDSALLELKLERP